MKKLILAATVLLGTVAASQAGVHVDFGIGLPLPPIAFPGRVVISQPAPVYGAPYCAPAPRYCEPRVVYVPQPRCYSYPSYGYGHSSWGYSGGYSRHHSGHSSHNSPGGHYR